MKKKMMMMMLLLFTGFLSLFPTVGHAGDFLGAPYVPDSQVTSQAADKVVLKTNRSHDQVVAFYLEAMKDAKDIKKREWKDVTYIEDDGSLPWHSITVSREDPATVTIKRDNWSWIIGMLVLRFVGVFVVLVLLWLGMSASGAIMSRLLPKSGAQNPAR